MRLKMEQMDKESSLLEKIKQKKLIIALIVIGVFISMSLLLYAMNPIGLIQGCLANKNYKGAVEIYNKRILGTSYEKEICKEFERHITQTETKWAEEELDYEKAVLVFKEIQKIDNKSLAKKAEQKAEFVLIEGKGNKYHLIAEEQYSSEEFAEAMSSIKKINEGYSQHAVVQELYEECKAVVLGKVSNPDSVKDFEEYIAFIKKCLKTVDEPTFASKKVELEKELVIFKEVVSFIEKAKTYYTEKLYKKVFDIFAEGLEKYPDNAKINSSFNTYRELYIVDVTKEAKKACEKKEYGQAIKIVNTAMENYSCEEFRLLLETVKEEKSVLYRIKNRVVETFTAFTHGWNKEELNIKELGLKTGSYMLKSGEKLVLGDYSDEDITVLSCSGNIISSLANVDLLFDIRDLSYDITHWGQSEYFVVFLAADVLALLPVVGVVKYFKYLNKGAESINNMADVVDVVSDVAKTSDNVGDVIEQATDVAKNSEVVTETTTDIVKHYEYIKTRNQHFEGMKHPSGIKYKRQKLEYSDGRCIQGVFPVFKSKFDCQLQPEFYKSSESVHFRQANEALKEKVAKDKLFAAKFNKQQLEDIKAGRNPNGYTWHHNEKEGLLQLVNTKKHDAAKHTGGMSIWGKGYNN